MRPAAAALSAVLLAASLAGGAAAADGDPAAGAELWSECRICHDIGDGAVNHNGPHLNALFGRKAGAIDGYDYSEALVRSGLVWTPEVLDAFIAAPEGLIPGTIMTYHGLDDPAARLDLIAYIATFQDVTEGGGFSPEVEAVLALPDDVAYGEYLSSECTACHSSGGAGIPAIGGMGRAAFVAAMLDYRSGRRPHQVMEMITGRLTDEDIAALAAFFAEEAG